MGTSFLEKFRILLKAIKIIRNWHTYLFVYFKWINTEYVILETKNRIKIKLRVNSTDLMAFTNVWLLREYDKPGFEIKNDDIIIDVGAHIGLFTLFASQFCKNGMIYCFEPIQENYSLLLSNLQLNNIMKVIPHNVAVSQNTDNVIIYLNKDESGHSMHIPGPKSVQVKSVSLKSIIDSNSLERCDLLKIDCEGEEYNIIDFLPSAYFDKIKKMCIEYHFADNKPSLLENLIKKLEAFSYTVNIRSLHKGIGFLYALKK